MFMHIIAVPRLSVCLNPMLRNVLRLLLVVHPLGVERPGLVRALVGMCAKQVALGLDKIGREVFASVAVVVG